eukprot:CAMPEP_0116840146 /NCGR_PEP_ID=MMETSP0418-20121206/10171_1 /TAXON_ID=1158023 /ORGANISM="Astrosyne radiata, Strain 13vi08-1A" /LENGTH=40 /DNA_ID= /DNA_START= /DNA_END= /DNA_ORIENTATION=
MDKEQGQKSSELGDKETQLRRQNRTMMVSCEKKNLVQNLH